MDNSNQPSEAKAKPKTNWQLIVLLVVIMGVGLVFAISSGSPTPSSSSDQVSSGTQSVCPQDLTTLKNAQSIDYKELIKDPNSFDGQNAKFTGKVLQIQESNGQGVMLLSVTSLGYGIYTDNIYVTYSGQTDAVEGDIVSVYGQMSGSYTYTSQANYQLTVPSMIGCTIDKTTPKAATPEITPQPTTNVVSQPVATPQTPKSWHTIATFSGETEKNTSPFTIQGSQWRIMWSETGSGYFGADADSSDGSGSTCSIANLVGPGSDSTYCYSPGTYYISTNTSNSWTVTVEDYY